MFKAIVRDVVDQTDGRQRPQLVSSMEIDFYFHGDVAVVIDSDVSEAQAAYESAAAVGTIEAYQAIIDAFPGSVQAGIAAAAIESLRTADQEAAEVQDQIDAEPDSSSDWETATRLVLERSGTCRDEARLRSLNSLEALPIEFVNSTGAQVRLYWLNFVGERILYADLMPGQMVSFSTFMTHPWVIADASGRCLAVEFPEHGNVQRVVRSAG